MSRAGKQHTPSLCACYNGAPSFVRFFSGAPKNPTPLSVQLLFRALVCVLPLFHSLNFAFTCSLVKFRNREGHGLGLKCVHS